MLEIKTIKTMQLDDYFLCQVDTIVIDSSRFGVLAEKGLWELGRWQIKHGIPTDRIKNMQNQNMQPTQVPFSLYLPPEEIIDG